MEQVKLEEFNLKDMKSTADQSTTYVLIQSFIKQLTLVVKQCVFHACNKSDNLQWRTEVAIVLQFMRCLGNQCDIMQYSSIAVNNPLHLNFVDICPGGTYLISSKSLNIL